MKAVFGAALTPLVVTSKPTEEAIMEPWAHYHGEFNCSKVDLIKKLRTAHKNTKFIPPLKKPDRYCIIVEYNSETGFREKRLKFVRYVGKKILRVGDVVDYTDENSNIVTNCTSPNIWEIGQLPRAGIVRLTPEELEKEYGPFQIVKFREQLLLYNPEMVTNG